MDYIQQAIEKARSERQGNIGKPKKKYSKENGSEEKGLPGSISYTRTKQINIETESLQKNRILAASKFDKRADVYRQLRTQVLQKLRANSWKTLAVTSPREGAGKTVTALNLAISISMEVNQTVLLVDLDLRTPSILKTLTINAEYGLVDHLKNDVAISEILINPGFERLVILPGKADPDYSSEILSSPEMKELLNDLTSKYESRIIIFDLPALLVNDDALVFTSVVDAALLVVEDGVTTQDEVEQSLHMLKDTAFIGTVLNKSEAGSAG